MSSIFCRIADYFRCHSHQYADDFQRSTVLSSNHLSLPIVKVLFKKLLSVHGSVDTVIRPQNQDNLRRSCLVHSTAVCYLSQKSWEVDYVNTCMHARATCIYNLLTHGRTVQKSGSNPQIPGKSHPGPRPVFSPIHVHGP